MKALKKKFHQFLLLKIITNGKEVLEKRMIKILQIFKNKI